MTDAGERLSSVASPALREDLRMLVGADGRRLVYCPMGHRYHEIDDDTFAILQHWRGDARLDELASRISRRLGTPIGVERLWEVATDLDRAGLLSEPLEGWRLTYERREARRRGPLTWLLHNYLFVRIPLVRPDRFLHATLPIARLFGSSFVLALITLLGLVGLIMVSRQWDAFSNTFQYFFSLEGAAGYLAALVLAKSIHELGHAYVARRFGCRVPTMGVALLVLVPVLYTDVTDAWRVRSRRDRLLITAAGMMAELSLAALATFLWALLPEGTLKSACFFIATTSWVMSLVINISPLMRFDGYYLLMDLWRIPNLQPRAFALLSWGVRETLFDLRAPCPEEWSTSRRAAVIVYAIAVCVYRLFLFIGIALLVYHLTFKLLGIMLFAVEIIWFVLRPIALEMTGWWRLRGHIASHRRHRFTLGVMAAVVIAAIVPWPYRIEIPAVIEPLELQRVAVSTPGQIKHIAVRNGDTVLAGALLLELDSPKLRAEIKAAETRLDLALLRRGRRSADALDRDQTLILDQEIASLREKLSGCARQREELALRANADGIVQDLAANLHVGRWLGRGEELAFVIAQRGRQVRGYIPGEMVESLKLGAKGHFVSDEPLMSKTSVELLSVSSHNAAALDLAYLSSTHGGDIAVNEDRELGPLPVEAQYQAVLAVIAPSDDIPVIRGIVRLEGQPQSLLLRFFKRAIAVLIRESGF